MADLKLIILLPLGPVGVCCYYAWLLPTVGDAWELWFSNLHTMCTVEKKSQITRRQNVVSIFLFVCHLGKILLKSWPVLSALECCWVIHIVGGLLFLVPSCISLLTSRLLWKTISIHTHSCYLHVLLMLTSVGYHMLKSLKSWANMKLPSSSCSVWQVRCHNDTHTDIQYLTFMSRGPGFPSAVRLNTATVSLAHVGALFTLSPVNGPTVAPAFCLR